MYPRWDERAWQIYSSLRKTFPSFRYAMLVATNLAYFGMRIEPGESLALAARRQLGELDDADILSWRRVGPVTLGQLRQFAPPVDRVAR